MSEVRITSYNVCYTKLLRNKKQAPQSACLVKLHSLGDGLLSLKTGTIGAKGLNCSVRDGKRCTPSAKATKTMQSNTKEIVTKNKTSKKS